MNNKKIYLDHAATAPVLPSVAEFVKNHVDSLYGNPSSSHRLGIEAKKEIDAAREILAAFLSCREDEIIFTGSGTEADNLAIFGGFAANYKRFGNEIAKCRVITSDSEHPAVVKPFEELESKSVDVIQIPCPRGELDLDALEAAVTENTALVSVMYVNNETGAVYNIKKASEIVKGKNKNALFHTDAVQALGKLKINLANLEFVDMMSFSAHKVGGLKGVGALFLRRGKRINPRIMGGGQENRLRSSTENTLGIISFGEAIHWYAENFKSVSEYMGNLYTYAEEKIFKLGLGVKINKPSVHSDYIMNLSMPSVRSEIMLNFLSENNIFVSSGSACSSRRTVKTPKYVLKSFGLDDKEADSVLRISFGYENNREDINIFCEYLKIGLQNLKK